MYLKEKRKEQSQEVTIYLNKKEKEKLKNEKRGMKNMKGVRRALGL